VKNKCPGSGRREELAWPPSLFSAGGLICPVCAIGMEVVHGTVRISNWWTVLGERYPTYNGIVRAHPRMGRVSQNEDLTSTTE